jgi:transcriptional regulator with GAF, ATPase, and Fis domain
MKNRLESESQLLRAELKSGHDFEEIVGDSEPMMVTLHKVESVASTDSTVLILGETGTGKELLARAIHDRSNRRNRPLVKIDCTTLPSGLVESELFGHQKGAFTGAYESKAGRFEVADGGTVFLDEVGELPIDLQAKLLRVIQERTFQRLGSERAQKTDVRLIAATNRDLRDEMREGRFRSDLYYRLGVFMIESPPLRDRREDIPLLVSYFVAKFSTSVGKRFESVAQSSMDALMAYDWPGNVRELQNVIERSVVLSPAGILHVREVLGDSANSFPASEPSLKHDLQNVERSNILRALRDSRWKVKGEGNAASRLGLKPSTLQSRMKRLGITRP